jgi:Domain of unknown function (DUF4926)
MSLPEFSRGVVTRDIVESGLSAGDVGVIVHVHRNVNKKPIGYMLEMFNIDGDSLDVVSVGRDDVRCAAPTDRMHVRVAA